MNFDSTDRQDPRDTMYGGRAMVAAFPNRASAQDCVDRLRSDNFHKIWIGVTSSTESVPADSGDSLAAKIGRFFSGDGDGEERGLVHSLVDHGVAESEARRIDRSMEPNSAILTVDGANHPELAAEIIEDCGGHIVAGEAFSTSDPLAAGTARGSQILGYHDSDRFARGREIDDEQRIQLRAERLNIDKERVSYGEATVRKDVVEQQQSIDVPTVREELFIERRAVGSETALDDATPIVEGETIRIPLTREAIRVTKRPVVTEEVVLGKRQITETQHVNESVREEKLVVEGSRESTLG